MKKIILALSIAILVLLASCENNIFYPSADTWEAGGQVFYTFSEAMEAMSGTGKDVSGTLPKSRTITLLKDITGDEHGESITIPSSFPSDMDLCINFNGKRYQFESDASQFLTVESGKKIEIINGTSIIPATAKEGPAIKVTSSGTTIENHVIIDNRPNKTSVETSGGTVELKTGTSMEGDVKVSGNCILTVSGANITASRISVVSDGGEPLMKIDGGSVRAGKVSVWGDAKKDAVAKVEVSNAGELNVDDLEMLEKGRVSVSGFAKVKAESTTASGTSETEISGGEVELGVTKLETGSSTRITGGSVNFTQTLTNETGTTFEITGGTITNPHSMDATVNTAIIAGGTTENVMHHTTHSPVKHEGHAATCHSTGMETYWSCDECSSLFSDEACLHEIAEPVIIPQLEHIPATTWSTTDYSHYHACTLCGDKLDEAFHEWSEEIDGKKHCLVCGLEIDMNVHTHWFPLEPTKEDYRYDQKGHWVECSCGEREHEGEHTFGDWYLSEDETYLIHECSVCGYKEVWVEDEAERIDVGFGTVIMPTLAPMACGDLKYNGENGVYKIWFEPYGNTPTDYSLFCYYKIGIKKYYPEQNEDGSYTIESDKTFTVYLQAATKGGTITRSAVVTP